MLVDDAPRGCFVGGGQALGRLGDVLVDERSGAPAAGSRAGRRPAMRKSCDCRSLRSRMHCSSSETSRCCWRTGPPADVPGPRRDTRQSAGHWISDEPLACRSRPRRSAGRAPDMRAAPSAGRREDRSRRRNCRSDAADSAIAGLSHLVNFKTPVSSPKADKRRSRSRRNFLLGPASKQAKV